jgi:hypothetical protein
MANDDDVSQVTLSLTQQQKEAIHGLFVEKGWQYSEVTKTSEAQSNTSEIQSNNDVDTYEPGYVIAQHLDEEECPFCLCKPCITNDRNRQQWWQHIPKPPHQLNTKLRKDAFKRFWTMLYHRRVWHDDRYLDRKRQALGLDRRRNIYHWIHRRDIMPDCVLKVVRAWYPNPPGMAYMGHMWE